MRKLFVWIVSCLAVGLSACATFRPQEERPYLTKPDTAKACADWRWIGVSRAGARCPDISGWTVRPLFPQVAPVRLPSGAYCDQGGSDAEVPSLEVIEKLNRFCVYEVAHPKKWWKDPPFPPAASTGLVRFDQDCAALSPSGPALVKKPWESDPEFLEQVGKPPTPLNIQNQGGVRLAFLDTQPTSEVFPTVSGRSPHGYILAHLARDLVCTKHDGHCAAQITTQLALPIRKFDPKSPKHNWIDRVHGGALGMQSDLAAAIYDEVASWQSKRSTQRHLVLNLSLAWDGNLFDGLDQEQISEMQAGTQAVYWALRYAAGFDDVLVFAAAGNQKRAPCENHGMLLPAAWEIQPPQEEICPGLRQETPRKIVYAVGGLQADDMPLSNARPGGMPPRAAFGENVFAGSSVSTAVAASIAALVWDSFPDLDAPGVMRILDNSGKALTSPADSSPAAGLSNAPRVRRLLLCDALRAACDQNPLDPCPLQSACDPQISERSRPGSSIPAHQGSCEPWLHPQPDDPPFPNCHTCPP
jgi:hypothetical protein